MLRFLGFTGAYGDNHWKWHNSGGPFSGANETREFIIESLGAIRRGGVETGMTQEWQESVGRDENQVKSRHQETKLQEKISSGREPWKLYKKFLWTDCTKISEVLGKEGEDMGTKEAGVFTGEAHQDSISKHHIAQPAIDEGETTTG